MFEDVYILKNSVALLVNKSTKTYKQYRNILKVLKNKFKIKE